MNKIHKIKLHTRYYDYVAKRIKNAEVRYNDKNYFTGDWLVLREWDGKEYTGRYEVRQAMGVFSLDGIGFEGWVLICMK